MAGLATIGVKMYKGGVTGGTLLPNLQSTPDIGGTPEKIDVTTLADNVRMYIDGVKDYGDLEFVFLYDGDQEDSSAWSTLKASENTTATYTVQLPDGTTFAFDAIVSCRLNAAEVNAALTFTASFSLQSDVTYTAATT